MNDFDKEQIIKYVPFSKQKKAFRLLKKGYPVQYIIGNVDFYDTKILVNKNVLIPRFETEYLVDDIIKLVKEKNFINPTILDIGTGSGNIAIALKKNIDANVCALDVSKKAINLAKKNASLNSTLINFICKSIEKYETDIKFDIIVSNPPYLKKGEYVDKKTKYEPQKALYANDDGLYFYKLILEKSKTLLKEKSLIAFEIGSYQKDALLSLISTYYPHAKVIAKNDLNDLNRYIYIINE